MSKLKKVKRALINQAYLDPALFDFDNITYGIRITHKATGETFDAYEKSVNIMGARLRIWAQSIGVKELNIHSDEWSSVWSRLKYETNEI